MAFFTTVFLAPFRLRMVLLSRPNGDIYRDYTDFLLFLPDLAMLVTLIAWVGARRFEIKSLRLGPAYVWIPLAGLTIAALLSSISSVDRALSIYHSMRLILLFLFYLYIVNEQISRVESVFAVGLGCALQVFIGISQSVLQRSIGLQALGEYPLDPAWAGVSIVSDGTNRFLRAYGLSDHPNILGGCLAFGMLVLLTAFLHEERRYKLIFGSLFLLSSLGLVLTFSRAAWLAVLGGSVLIVGLEAKARGAVPLKSAAILFLCTMLILLPFTLINIDYFNARLNVEGSFELNGNENQSVNERAFLNQYANQVFVKYALTGVGMSASPVAMSIEYPEFSTDYQPPHFVLLAVALETGMFGAIFYFLLMFLPWFELSRRAYAWTDPQVIGAAGLLLAVTIVGFFDYYTWFSTPGRLWQWLAWGLFAVAIESSSSLQAKHKLGEVKNGVRGAA